MQGQSNTTSPALACWGVRITGSLTALIGAFWLTAWLIGVVPAWSGMITPKTNNSLALLLGGLALLLLAPVNVFGWRKWLGAVFSTLVLIIGALTLSEHLFGWNLGIDQLLATEPAGAAATISPNRMGPPASTSHTLLGFGLLAMALGHRRIAPYLGLAACIINLVPAVGFLYSAPELYSKPYLTGIAWPTVVALFSLGVGLVLARVASGPMVMLLRNDAGGILMRRMLPVALLLPLILGFLRVHGQYHGLYGTALGTALTMITFIVIFSALLWQMAARLSQSEESLRELDAHKQEFYRKTILAATGGKLAVVEPEDIYALQGELIRMWKYVTPDGCSLTREESIEIVKSFDLEVDKLHGFMACAGEMLSNALKHAGSGEAYLYSTGNGILFIVTDNGPGIDSINLPDVAFVRGYSTAGTGGLGYKLIIASADKTYLATGSEGTTVAVELTLRNDETPSDAYSIYSTRTR